MKMKEKFIRVITVVDRTGNFTLDCDYGSPFGKILRESVKRGWVIIRSTTLLEYHTEACIKEKARHKYELELTEEGRTLYDFHQL